MNKNDVDTLAQALVFSESNEEFVAKLLAMDPRIPIEVEAYKVVAGNDEATRLRFEELMAEEYGPRWVLSKAASAGRGIGGRNKQLWDQAYKEVRA